MHPSFEKIQASLLSFSLYNVWIQNDWDSVVRKITLDINIILNFGQVQFRILFHLS